MSFARDDQDWDLPEEDGPDWKKEPSRRDSRFDFAAFLGSESLEDKITDALDGKDLLDKDAYGEFPPDYVPRRAPAGERGRHEAPGSAPEEDEDEEDDDILPTQRFTLSGGASAPRRPAREDAYRQEPYREDPPVRPVYAQQPPPRPKVVVSEPTPRVYVTPQSEYGGQEPPRRGGGKALKWLVALMLSAAVILAALLAVSLFAGPGGSDDPAATAEPTPTDYLAGLLRPNTPAPSPSPTPVPTPSPTPRVTYTITVTAGSGGSVSPNGTVDVEEGGSVTFAINPNEGYGLGQLLIDGSPVSVQSSYTFSDVKSNHTIYGCSSPRRPPRPRSRLPQSRPPQNRLPRRDPPPNPPWSLRRPRPPRRGRNPRPEYRSPGQVTVRAIWFGCRVVLCDTGEMEPGKNARCKSTVRLCVIQLFNRKGRHLAGVAFSCVSRVSPVVPSACGRYEIHHLKRLPESIVTLLYCIYSRL